MLCRKAGRDEGMVLSDRTKGCCSSDLNEPLHPNHDQFAELDAHNCASAHSEVVAPRAGRGGTTSSNPLCSSGESGANRNWPAGTSLSSAEAVQAPSSTRRTEGLA